MENLSFEFLTSKRFISAVSYVISLIIVFYLPEFEGMELDIASGLTLVFGLLILGYSTENVVKALVIARALAARTATPLDDALIAGAAGVFGVKLPSSVEANLGELAR